jgi:hypothetical protein
MSGVESTIKTEANKPSKPKALRADIEGEKKNENDEDVSLCLTRNCVCRER